MKKKVICIVLAAILVVGIMVVTVATSGKCGDNAKWRFNVLTGTLTISGEGEMRDYIANPNYDNRPWEHLCDDIKTICIRKGITTIGDGVFAGCENVANITIPDSIITIGEGAFENCTNLTTIIIPNCVESIDDYAFYGCTSLVSVTIPDSVIFIGKNVFKRCTKLTTIYGETGSYAETYAIENNISFVALSN